MAPICPFDFERATVYRPVAARLAHKNFGSALGFYRKFKIYRAAMFTMFVFSNSLIWLDPSWFHQPPLVLVSMLLLPLLFFELSCTIDCWCSIKWEYYCWNNGLCRKTCKAWRHTMTRDIYYRSIHFRSGDESLRLLYIEPQY